MPCRRRCPPALAAASLPRAPHQLLRVRPAASGVPSRRHEAEGVRCFAIALLTAPRRLAPACARLGGARLRACGCRAGFSAPSRGRDAAEGLAAQRARTASGARFKAARAAPPPLTPRAPHSKRRRSRLPSQLTSARSSPSRPSPRRAPTRRQQRRLRPPWHRPKNTPMPRAAARSAARRRPPPHGISVLRRCSRASWRKAAAASAPSPHHRSRAPHPPPLHFNSSLSHANPRRTAAAGCVRRRRARSVGSCAVRRADAGAQSHAPRRIRLRHPPRSAARSSAAAAALGSVSATRPAASAASEPRQLVCIRHALGTSAWHRSSARRGGRARSACARCGAVWQHMRSISTVACSGCARAPPRGVAVSTPRPAAALKAPGSPAARALRLGPRRSRRVRPLEAPLTPPCCPLRRRSSRRRCRPLRPPSRLCCSRMSPCRCVPTPACAAAAAQPRTPPPEACERRRFLQRRTRRARPCCTALTRPDCSPPTPRTPCWSPRRTRRGPAAAAARRPAARKAAPSLARTHVRRRAAQAPEQALPLAAAVAPPELQLEEEAEQAAEVRGARGPACRTCEAPAEPQTRVLPLAWRSPAPPRRAGAAARAGGRLCAARRRAAARRCSARR